jgi:hypothetical protein
LRNDRLYILLLEQNYKHTMNQSDINYVAELLSKAVKRNDWECVTEALEYVQEFQEDAQYEEE